MYSEKFEEADYIGPEVLDKALEFERIFVYSIYIISSLTHL